MPIVLTFFNLFSNEVIVKFNMFCSCMKNQIIRESHGTLKVAISFWWSNNHSQFFEAFSTYTMSAQLQWLPLLYTKLLHWIELRYFDCSKRSMNQQMWCNTHWRISGVWISSPRKSLSLALAPSNCIWNCSIDGDGGTTWELTQDSLGYPFQNTGRKEVWDAKSHSIIHFWVFPC